MVDGSLKVGRESPQKTGSKLIESSRSISAASWVETGGVGWDAGLLAWGAAMVLVEAEGVARSRARRRARGK
jgi:hypothetical protein